MTRQQSSFVFGQFPASASGDAVSRVGRLLCAAWLLVAACAMPAAAQLSEGALSGKIVDATGQTLPGCDVVVTNIATGIARTAVTDETGLFRVIALPPGVYAIEASLYGFQTVKSAEVRVNVGQTTEVSVELPLAGLSEKVSVSAQAITVEPSREARLADSFGAQKIENLPLPARDIYALPKMSAGATIIPGAALSQKLSSSPVITVNGNRYRGNNYILDGAMNTNANNTGEPAIVPSLESVEEMQVQTLNFASEFGRGNGAVVNVTTRAGTNAFRGRVWEYYRSDKLNAKNYFAPQGSPQNFNQFGANLGGPLVQNRTFFFGSYEGSRDDISRPFSFTVETPEFRDYVIRTNPNGVAARLLRQYPAPTPVAGVNGQRYLDQRDMATPQGPIPAIGRAQVLVDDIVKSHQVLARIDHNLSNMDRLSLRYISEWSSDQGGTQVTSQATLGRAIRGFRGPFDGLSANLNAGYMRVMDRAVNDFRVALQVFDATRGREDASVPTISITGVTSQFGDVFANGTRLRTLEFRDIYTKEQGRHSLRAGVEARRISKGLSIGPASAGTFTFGSIQDFANDLPFSQTLTVQPATGEPTAFPRHFTQYETGAFVQDQWTVSSRLSISLGLRHDYFGTVTERDGLLSSVILGPGATFREQIAGAAIGRVDRLYEPQTLNFSPRVGLAWDLLGNGRSSIRSGFSRAYQPHHGQSISGARALPPDAVQGVIQPSTGIGTQILYDVPVPYNPQFGRGLNAQGGVVSRPGEPAIRTTGFVVNPVITTQYTESWFVNHQQRLGDVWMFESGYVSTRGVDLERIDDVNRFAGDLLDGREDRLNPNFGVLLFVTNGVKSKYDAMTLELRREVARGLSLQTNYRFSRWLDTSSDTSTGQFQDNSEPGKGAQDIDCLQCEWGRSLFDIPHRFMASATWAPAQFDALTGVTGALARGWRLSAVFTRQSGRPFSVWNNANFRNGGDYNADGGGGSVGGGFYDRPNAPDASVRMDGYDNDDFLNGLFPASAFPRPTPGTNGTLGRNTFRGPRYMTLDMNLTRGFAMGGVRRLELRVDAFNVLNTLNLFLPNADLSLPTFGKSTQAFDPRIVQVGFRFLF